MWQAEYYYHRGHVWRGVMEDGYTPSHIIYYGRFWWSSYNTWMMPGMHGEEFDG